MVAILAIVQHTQGRTTSGVALIISLKYNRRSDDVRRAMPSSTMVSMHGQMISTVEIPSRPCTADTIIQRQLWHDIMALGQHTRSDDVGRWMPIFLGQHRGSEYPARGMPLSIMVIIFELI